MIRAWTLVAGIGPAFVLVLAGIAKLHDPLHAARFLSAVFGWTLSTAFGIASGVGLLEIAVGLSICATLGRSVLAPLAAACLFAAFAGMLVMIASSSPTAARCGCFGGLMGGFLMKSLWVQAGLDVLFCVCLLAHTGALRKRAPINPQPEPA